MGLDDDIVIAKIKAGSPAFQLGDSDLIELKKVGVSSKVIAAMLESSVLTAPRVMIDDKPTELHVLGQSKVGGCIGRAATFGIKSVKSKAFLQGSHSDVVVGQNPIIEIELPKRETIDNFILVQLDGKDERRELEVASSGGIGGGKQGIRAEAICETKPVPLGGNKFKLGTQPLKKGEYIVYVVGSADAIKGIYGRGYDFSVLN